MERDYELEPLTIEEIQNLIGEEENQMEREWLENLKKVKNGTHDNSKNWIKAQKHAYERGTRGYQLIPNARTRGNPRARRQRWERARSRLN